VKEGLATAAMSEKRNEGTAGRVDRPTDRRITDTPLAIKIWIY